MDSDRIDRIVRTFGQTRSRRQALRSLAGVAAGAVALGGRAARADVCKRAGKACKRDNQCCSQNCVGTTGGSTAHSDGVCSSCPPGRVKVNGSCALECSIGGAPLCAAVNPSCGCIVETRTGLQVCVNFDGDAPGPCSMPGGCPTGTGCWAHTGNHCIQLCEVSGA